MHTAAISLYGRIAGFRAWLLANVSIYTINRIIRTIEVNHAAKYEK
jgi:hypothetical protein